RRPPVPFIPTPATPSPSPSSSTRGSSPTPFPSCGSWPPSGPTGPSTPPTTSTASWPPSAVTGARSARAPSSTACSGRGWRAPRWPPGCPRGGSPRRTGWWRRREDPPPVTGDPTGASAGSWVVVQHVDHEGPGLIGEAIAEAGWAWRVVRPDRGEPLPADEPLAGLVVMGGPMGVHDTDRHPWLVAERDLIGRVVRAGRPVLGVCLGAQQLAAALGAEVTTGPEPEIGPGRVHLTPAGRRDPVLGPE